MALFKLRKKVDEPVAAPAPAEGIEAMRRRARHRLIGAAVLVLAGVIGFPLLFDTQPRPVSVDIPIDIPDRNKVKPLPAPAQAPVASGQVSQAASAPPPATRVAAAPVASAAAAPEAKAPAPEAKAPAPEKVGKAEAPVEKKPEPQAEAKPAAPGKVAKAAADEDAARARALLAGKTVDSAGRYVVQVGAFAESTKAHQAQLKLQRAGLKNYTQVADTGDGKRIRVRAGPFASRAEADKAAEKIKGLALPARILAL
jgi:DedD protein